MMPLIRVSVGIPVSMLLIGLSFLVPLVHGVQVSSGIPVDAPGAESELPVWAASFNLGVLDTHAKANNIVKRCELLFPTNAPLDASTFQVYTLQWEKEGSKGFWFEIFKQIISK